MVKKDTSTPRPAPTVTTDAAASIPVIALVLGITSLVTFTWFLGIPAIVLGIIGLRRYRENRGFSIAGLVTGAISTVLMIGAFLFFMAMIVLGIMNSDTDYSEDTRSTPYSERGERNYNERYYQDYREGI